jgi:hypothetical protein
MEPEEDSQLFKSLPREARRSDRDTQKRRNKSSPLECLSAALQRLAPPGKAKRSGSPREQRAALATSVFAMALGSGTTSRGGGQRRAL